MESKFETVQPASSKQTIVCQSFSDDNYGVTVSSCQRNCVGSGYYFFNHPEIKKNQILKWSLRVPKLYGGIGMVIILELIIFDFTRLMSEMRMDNLPVNDQLPRFFKGFGLSVNPPMGEWNLDWNMLD